MKSIECPSCGSKDLYEENGYRVCRYCGTKLILTHEDRGIKESTISLHDDVKILLQKCKDDPSHAKKYAQLILEIDSSNVEARQYLSDGTGDGTGKNGGCYVATAVYGSYNCPQVWTLRRYRDNTLSETWLGRMFIALYYAISPSLVRWFGKTQWFRNMWKPKLDKMVERLNREGVADTPYRDRQW